MGVGKKSLLLEIVKEGNKNYNFEISDLESGLYICQIKIGNEFIY